MRPHADEILQSVIRTFDDEVIPRVDDPDAKGLCNTISNLLRHVLLRMETEPAVLHADSADLARLLARIDGFFGRADERPAAPGANAEIPTVRDLDAHNDRLRRELERDLATLQRDRADLRQRVDYAPLRAEIRAYLDRQLTREAGWIDPAFTRARR